MMRARVDANLQALVPLLVQSKDGQLHSTVAVLDTGFDGCLSLPHQSIRELGLEPDLSVNVIMADGQNVLWDTWDGYVLWHGHIRNILIFETEETPLLGMELLQGSQLIVQVQVGGDVLIEELDRIES